MTMGERSLRRRVLGEALAAMLVFIAGGVLMFWIALDRILFTVAADDARGQATEISRLLTHNRLTPQRVDDEVASHGTVIQVIDQDGRVVGVSPASVSRQPVTGLRPAAGDVQVTEEGSATQLTRRWAVVAEGIRPVSGPRAGQQLVVLVAAPLNPIRETVQIALGWLAVGGLAVLVVVGFLVRRSVDAALEPVRRITEEVKTVRDVRHGARVSVPATGDEITQLATVMNQMLDRLDQSDVVTRTFLSNVSHELRSPLTTIQVVVEARLQDRTAAHPGDRVVQVEVLRMQRLVDDLLSLVRADTVGLALAVDEVDLDDLVDQEVRRLRATSRVAVQAHIEAARVIGDAGRLQQVLRNITENAERHAETTISLRLVTSSSCALLTIDNDGPPVPQESREVVFDRFVRLQEANRRPPSSVSSGRSGLGLTIAKTIVEAHGGRIRALASPAGWCRFEIILPLQGGDDPSPGDQSPSPGAAA